ncbi:MAG TPA: 4a-hydroxytetrahydrobiopterin dehydratase [Planctomycetota bacterium]|jgi:4a-hydroxytetrahydrobiopterin dehydratase
MVALAKMKCIPCKGGIPPLSPEEIAPLAVQVPAWQIGNGHHLHRLVPTRDFAESLALANRIGAVAEKAGHHPDLLVAWGRVVIDIFTHKIDGLTQSDFILAAKIDELLGRKRRATSKRG